MNYDMTPKLLVIAAIAAAAVLCFFVVRRLVRRKKADAAGTVIVLALLGAGLLALGAALLFIGVRVAHETDVRVRQQASVRLAAPEPRFDFRQAWTDKYPPKDGTEFPEWVASNELRDPPRESLPVDGVEFSFVKTDGQDRVAGFSDIHATSAEATARAWECLRARIDGRVLARCALRAPREFVPVRTLLGTAIAERIAREIDAHRTLRAPTTFEDEVEVAGGLGSAYRAAQYVVCSGVLVDDIARAAAENAASELRAEHEKRVKEAKTWASLVGGALFLLLIITSVYLFLNAHTKGYYAWPLRIVACSIYLIAIAAYLLYFRRFTGV